MDIDDPMTTDQEDSSYPDSSAPSSEECCPFAVKNLSGDQGIADTVVRRGSEVQAPAHPVTVDDGIEEPVNLDHILRAQEYYGEMDRLAHETAESCRIDLVLTELSSLSKTHCLIILWGCHESMDRLRRESFCHSFFSIFVEDISRGVAETVYISMEEIELLIACIEKRVEYSDETQEQLLEELAARLRLCDVDNVLGQVVKALALGLVSFSVSHANRFDVELSSEDMGRINIGPRLDFSIRELACLDRFIGGPVWILGRSNSTSKLKLSIQVEHFDLIWGPIWFLEDGSIMARKGYIVRAEQTNTCVSDEIESHWTDSPSSSNTTNELMPSSKLLIGSGQAPLATNPSCTSQIQQPLGDSLHVTSNLQLLSIHVWSWLVQVDMKDGNEYYTLLGLLSPCIRLDL